MSFNSAIGIGGSTSSSTDMRSDSAFTDINDNASVTSIQGLRLDKHATANINMIDNGAVRSAFEFADKQSSQAYDFSRDVTDNVISKTSSQISNAIQAVSESARSETENIFINLQKYLFYGAIIWGAVMIFRTVKK